LKVFKFKSLNNQLTRSNKKTRVFYPGFTIF
jgi:hypothetical protein